MEDRGVRGGRESSVAHFGSRLRLRRAIRHQLLGPPRFPLRQLESSLRCPFLMLISVCGGEKGREFITAEHCGNDFLAELAETMQDTGDWDDLKAAKLEACGVLTDMFGQDIPNEGECSVVHDVNIIEDSPQPKKNQTFLEVDSSTGSEDEDDIFGSKMGKKSACYIPDQSSTPSNSSTQLLARRSLESMIWLGIGPCNCMDQIRGLKNVSLL